MEYDLIIIGMGISGISAAIYAKNSGLNVLMLERDVPGGLLNKINKITNYPGFPEISGPDLSYQLFETINQLKVPYKITDVINIKIENDKKIIETVNGNYECKKLIIATGRNSKKLKIENEEKLLGHGISNCALCDGSLYKGKDIAVVGGGNSAVEEAIYLSSLANKIYVIHRRDTFRAEESLVDELKKKKNVEFVLNSQVTSIQEENNQLTSIIINNKKEIPVSAMFTYIGFEPNNEFLKDLNITDDSGYITVNQNYETNISGVYAVGDCIKKEVYQLITAANDGVIAAVHIIKNIKKNKNSCNPI